MRMIYLTALLFTLTGCTTNNSVETMQPEQSVVKYQKQSIADKDPRFSNLYPGEKSYPITCEKDCYPQSPVVDCKSPAENCTYTGNQVRPKLASGFNIRWLGHASFYIESNDGSSFLFDPVSEQFDWPVNWAFRLSAGFNRQPGAWPTQQQIEDVDAVMYSHIHYDHFNKDDIAVIGNKPEYLVPLGFAEHFEQGGYQIKEMTWFSSKTIGDTKVHFVPAHHFSSRIWVPYLYEDNNKSLWGGWVIEHQGKRLFYAGDTGYSQHFADIAKAYGDMDVCLLPIASYHHKENGKWYRYVHTTPEDALVAAKDLNCKVMIPWGYGNASWKMGDHSSHSALLRLLHMHKTVNPDLPLYILNEGEAIHL